MRESFLAVHEAGSVTHRHFPTTRYQGSKRKLASGIMKAVADLEFTTVLDAFGGTGAVAYAFKRAGKQVTYNDILAFNHQVGLALIENDEVELSEEEFREVGRRNAGVQYDDFIEDTFDGIYFTRDENRWLDVAVGNIRAIPCRYRRAIAWYALFQSALIKRPYNLFHRKNLHMRLATVERGFGNKTSWDRPFEDHFQAFAREANGALFRGRRRCISLCGDALQIQGNFDLVYIDPPYINASGVSVPYREFYHFLEGLIDYDNWPGRVDVDYKHRPLHRIEESWCDASKIRGLFADLFDRFRDSIVLVSYRSDGIPEIAELSEMLAAVKKEVRVIYGIEQPYALSTNRSSREVLLIGT